MVFNDEDHLVPPMIQSVPCIVDGAYHLNVDYDDEHASQSIDSIIVLNIPPIEESLEGERSNENLSKDVSNEEFNSFIFETTIDISPINIVQEGLKDNTHMK